MARFRSRGMALRPINRIKHVVDNAGTVSKNVNFDVILIEATDTPALADTNGVQTGSKVNGIYLKVVVASNDPFDAGVIPNCYMYIIKDPGGNLTLPSANATGGSDDKRFIIHQEMNMIQNVQGGNKTILFDGVIVIPKGYRRFGPNDRLTFRFIAGQLDTAVCLQVHYKEFR